MLDPGAVSPRFLTGWLKNHLHLGPSFPSTSILISPERFGSACDVGPVFSTLQASMFPSVKWRNDLHKSYLPTSKEPWVTIMQMWGERQARPGAKEQTPGCPGPISSVSALSGAHSKQVSSFSIKDNYLFICIC